MADEQKQEEPVTFRDRRKVDPETGEARPATDGADTAGAADTAAPAGDGEQVAGPADGEDPEVEKLRAEVAERTGLIARAVGPAPAGRHPAPVDGGHTSPSVCARSPAFSFSRTTARSRVR